MDCEAALYFRDQFRVARERAIRDAEAYDEVLFAIERFGCVISGEVGSLGTYDKHILPTARDSPLAEDVPEDHPDWHIPFPKLYEMVKDARNDALHQGAYARHLTTHAAQLVLVLEDALNENHAFNVGDYMVRDPLCAFPWQPVSIVRQQMLANNFSYLPLWTDWGAEPGWQLVADYHVARYLRSAPNKNGKDGRKERLGKTLKEALGSPDLKLTEVQHCYSYTLLEEAVEKLDGEPVLLVLDSESHDRLVGILTPFDLL